MRCVCRVQSLMNGEWNLEWARADYLPASVRQPLVSAGRTRVDLRLSAIKGHAIGNNGARRMAGCYRLKRIRQETIIVRGAGSFPCTLIPI